MYNDETGIKWQLWTGIMTCRKGSLENSTSEIPKSKDCQFLGLIAKPQNNSPGYHLHPVGSCFQPLCHTYFFKWNADCICSWECKRIILPTVIQCSGTSTLHTYLVYYCRNVLPHLSRFKDKCCVILHLQPLIYNSAVNHLKLLCQFSTLIALPHHQQGYSLTLSTTEAL